MEILFITGAIIISVGVIFLILGIIFCLTGNNKKKYSAITVGQVIDMCKNANSFNTGGDGEGAHFGAYVTTGNTNKPKTNRCPVFIYTVNGMQYKRADSISYDIRTVERMMNKPVNVFYNPSEPSDAKLSVRSPLMIVGFTFIGVSVLLLAMGIAFIGL